MSKDKVKKSIEVNRTIDQLNGPVLLDVEVTGVLTGFQPMLKNSFGCRTINGEIIYQSSLGVYGNDGKRYEIPTIGFSNELTDTIHSEFTGRCVTIKGALYYASAEEEPVNKLYLLAYELTECNDESKKDTIALQGCLREPLVISYKPSQDVTCKMYIVEKKQWIYPETMFIQCIVNKEQMQKVEAMNLKSRSTVKVKGYIQPAKYIHYPPRITMESLVVNIVEIEKVENIDKR